MGQLQKYIPLVIVGLLISLGLSVIIYFWPQLSFGSSKRTSPQPTTQAPGRVSGLKNSASGSILSVSKDTVTIRRADSVTETYRFNTPRVYVLFRDKLGVKGFIGDLKEGQRVEYTSEVGSKEEKTITSIIIE